MAEIKSNSLLLLLGDPLKPTGDAASEPYRFKGGMNWWVVALVVGVVLLAVTGFGAVSDPKQFFFSYLVGYMFCLTVTLGALFFVLVQHLTKAQWSAVVRRVPEALIWAFPLLAVLSIPILIGMHDLYHWTHHELLDPASPEYDSLIAGKAAYLNVPFFIGRVILYFVLWTFISHRLYTLSIKMDLAPSADIPKRLRKVSAFGIVIFGLTIAFSGFDFVMSVDPHWFSTMFGVYIFAGSFMSSLAMIIFVLALLQKSGGMLHGVVTVEHFQDLGKFLFGFTVFWAYIAFSQYMLYWYGNIPEETIWFRHRLEHGWQYHSAVLLVMHFIVPFIVLIPRWTKRILPLLTFMSVYMLVMHWFDLHWLIMPVLDLERGGHAGFHWMSFTAFLGLFMILLGAQLYRLSRHSLVPQNDPYLAESLRFHST